MLNSYDTDLESKNVKDLEEDAAIKMKKSATPRKNSSARKKANDIDAVGETH